MKSRRRTLWVVEWVREHRAPLIEYVFHSRAKARAHISGRSAFRRVVPYRPER
jgi:hypothetical protein